MGLKIFGRQAVMGLWCILFVGKRVQMSACHAEVHAFAQGNLFTWWVVIALVTMEIIYCVWVPCYSSLSVTVRLSGVFLCDTQCHLRGRFIDALSFFIVLRWCVLWPGESSRCWGSVLVAGVLFKCLPTSSSNVSFNWCRISTNGLTGWDGSYMHRILCWGRLATGTREVGPEDYSFGVCGDAGSYARDLDDGGGGYQENHPFSSS